jgi:hypothetical protein
VLFGNTSVAHRKRPLTPAVVIANALAVGLLALVGPYALIVAADLLCAALQHVELFFGREPPPFQSGIPEEYRHCLDAIHLPLVLSAVAISAIRDLCVMSLHDAVVIISHWHDVLKAWALGSGNSRNRRREPATENEPDCGSDMDGDPKPPEN